MTLTITQTDDIAPCLAIRRTVFIEEQGVAEEIELEGDVPSCLHYLAETDGTPVATLRITPKGTIAKIERVAVLAQARGTGIGAHLMRHVMADLPQKGFTEVHLGSQIVAQQFYAKLGFTTYGDTFLDADIPHIMMMRPL